MKRKQLIIIVLLKKTNGTLRVAKQQERACNGLMNVNSNNSKYKLVKLGGTTVTAVERGAF
jgi:hypothetical protein